MKRQRSLAAAVLGLMCVASVVRASEPNAAAPPMARWDPLAKPVREPDTLFRPDFTSWKTIEAEGGFLAGPHDKTSEQVKDNFEFGPGKFGPAVRGKPGPYNFVFYPVDGLLDAAEFTLEFQARSDKPWSALESGRPIFAVAGEGNRLEIMPDKGQFQVSLGSLEGIPEAKSSKHWEKPCEELKLTADAWHAVALTLKQGTLRIYIDGVEAGKIDDVRFLPIWSDDTRTAGIRIGGAPGASSGFWISDLRISRTARVPGQPVTLRSLEGSLVVDAKQAAGDVPAHLLGSVHPAVGPDGPMNLPEKIRSAIQVVRTDKLLTATPMKRGEPDAEHPTAGKSGKFSYDWRVVDRTFDWMKEHGVRPYISIDSTPSLLGGSVKPFSGKALANGLSATSGFGPEAPADFDDWASIVGDLAHHVLNEKKQTVLWWSVWNEPADGGGFWNAGLGRYLDLYAVSARAVRAVDPKARVGGPEPADLDAKFIKALFDRCAKDKLPLDFIAYHDYTGDLTNLDRARALVDSFAKQAGFPTPFPILVGEFNWSGDNLYKTGVARFNSGMWHIRALGAAYTTAYLTRMAELPGFEQLIISHTTYGDPREGGAASAQLLGPKGEQWAPYNAFKGWKQTVGTERLAAVKDLPPGVFALASRDPKTGRVGLVLVNYGWAQRQVRTMHVSVKNLGGGAWRMKRSLIDSRHSSRWDLAEDREEGRAQNDLQMVQEKDVNVADGTAVELEVKLPAWGSTFIAIARPESHSDRRLTNGCSGPATRSAEPGR